MNFERKVYINYASPLSNQTHYFSRQNVVQEFNLNPYQNYRKMSFKINEPLSYDGEGFLVRHIRRVSSQSKGSDQITFDKQFNKTQKKLQIDQTELSGKSLSSQFCKVFMFALLIPLFLGILYGVLSITVKKDSRQVETAKSVNFQLLNKKSETINNFESSSSYIQSNKQSERITAPTSISSLFVTSSTNIIQNQESVIHLPVVESFTTFPTVNIQASVKPLEYILPQTKVQNPKMHMTQKIAQSLFLQEDKHVQKLFQETHEKIYNKRSSQ